MDAVLGHKPAIQPRIVESQAVAEPTTSTAEDNTEDDMKILGLNWMSKKQEVGPKHQW